MLTLPSVIKSQKRRSMRESLTHGTAAPTIRETWTLIRTTPIITTAWAFISTAVRTALMTTKAKVIQVCTANIGPKTARMSTTAIGTTATPTDSSTETEAAT